jgi:hypothetical protein
MLKADDQSIYGGSKNIAQNIKHEEKCNQYII